MPGEDTRSERELPPLVVGDDFKCTNFHFQAGSCFHMHGGITLMRAWVGVALLCAVIYPDFQRNGRELASQGA